MGDASGMAETKLRYGLHPGSIGAALSLDRLEQLTADAGELAQLQGMLDARGVVCIRTQHAFEPSALAVLERVFGRSASRGGSMLVAGSEFIDDYSIPPKVDDGRPRKVAPTDFIHIDTMSNGPAAYGVHATLAGTSVAPMRFADMRAVYAAQSDEMKRKLSGLRARHSVPRAPAGQVPASTLQPLAAKHPRSDAPLLLLPNRINCQVEGMADAEATQLIGALWSATERSPATLELPLQPNTLIIWDNIMCTHTNPGFPRAPGRTVWFFNTLIEGPVAPL